MYWHAGFVDGGLARHPTGLTASCLLLMMFIIVEGGWCLRGVEVGAVAKGNTESADRAGALRLSTVPWTRRREVVDNHGALAQIARNVRIGARLWPISVNFGPQSLGLAS